MKSILFVATFVVSALATRTSPNVLFRRQTGDECPSGYKICGEGCILTTYTCCPDGSGGCGPTDICQLGTNNKYLCCPQGETCSGTGGVQTSYIYSTTSGATARTSSTPSSVRTSSAASVTSTSDECESGWKTCGNVCIPLLWSCCPDQRGGCDPDVARCWLGTNGLYGCCPNTATNGCSGAAGAATTLPSTYSDVVGATTTSRSSSRTSSTAPTITRSTSAIASNIATTSASTASIASPPASGANHLFTNPFASLVSFIAALLALVP